MFGKGSIERIEFRFIKMSLEDTCFEIVQANEFRDTPEGVKSAFMTADEALNVRVPDHFFVGMARVGKDQFEEPGPMVAATFLSRCTLSEVDLCFFSSSGVDTGKELRGLGFQLSDVAFDAVIAVRISVFDNQILINSLC